MKRIIGVKRKKSKVKIKAKKGALVRRGYALQVLEGMALGYCYRGSGASYKRVFCVRVRKRGICSYVMLGKERGKTLVFVTFFTKLSHLSEEQEKRIRSYQHNYKQLGI